jgi:hypothetical protein
VPLGVYRATRRPVRRRGGRKRFAFAASVLGLGALGFFCWQLYVSYERLGDLDKLAEHQAAQEQGAGQPAAPAVPAASSAAVPGANEAHPPGTDDAAESAPDAGPGLLHGPGADALFPAGRPLELPLPEDGGALRQLMPATDGAQGPFLINGEAVLPSPASGSWSPENLDGYRFYVRSIDRTSVEIFRTGIPRTETVLNNPL